MLDYCWASVGDAGLTINQHWPDISRLLGSEDHMTAVRLSHGLARNYVINTLGTEHLSRNVLTTVSLWRGIGSIQIMYTARYIC